VRPERIVALTALLGMLWASCGGSSSAPSAPPAAAAGSFSSPHFLFQYTTLDADNIGAIAAAVESVYPRIIAELLSDALPQVNVTFYLDHSALETAALAAGVVVPPWASGLATAENHIHLISPNLRSWGAYDRLVSNLVHEFAHCVSLHLNGRIANNPRWFWESVAIYESRQFVEPKTLAYLTARTPPSFDRLNAFDNTLVYDVGYLIAEFVIARWGQASLHDLIAVNGDTSAALGVSQPVFEQQWFAFVQDRYGL